MAACFYCEMYLTAVLSKRLSEVRFIFLVAWDVQQISWGIRCAD